MVGTVLPLLVIELLGFHGTLWVGVDCNGCIAMAATHTFPKFPKESAPESPEPVTKPIAHAATDGSGITVLLFLTGLTSMGMEVVWVRQFTPYLGTVVYAFAGILCVYLAATFVGFGHLPPMERAEIRRIPRRESCVVDSTGAGLGLLAAGDVESEHQLSKALRTGLGDCAFHRPTRISYSDAGRPAVRQAIPAKAGSVYAMQRAGMHSRTVARGIRAAART